MAASRPHASRSRLVLLVAVAISLLILDERGISVIRHLREGAATVFDPMQEGVTRASRPLSEAWQDAASDDDIDDVRAENKALREQNAELKANQISGQDATRQLSELTQTLDLSGLGDVKSVAARVTSGPRSNMSHAIEINKGSDQGITEGMPAVTNAGLVGKVTQVTKTHATVELITSPDFRVGVRLAETGEMGTARGRGRDETLVIDSNVQPGTEVRQGAGVVTSGVDRSAFPDAIPIGLVSSSREAAGGLSLELLVKPLVDVDRLSYLNVLLWEPPQ